MKRTLAISTLVLAACGAEPSLTPYDGSIGAPTPRKARVTVTPAMDFSDASEHVGQHFVVDELVVNLADVRILGEDPSIPAGGYPLMSEPALIYAEGSGEVGIELPFPPAFLEQEGLAIYLRADPSEDLEGASIVVAGRWVDDAADGNALTGVVDPDGEPVQPIADRDGVVDPDGEPVLPGERDDGVVDPDGEPVRPEDETGVVDPDGEPVDCLEVDCGTGEQALVDGTPVVLREIGAVELVVTLGERSRFNLVFGIPAARWIDDETTAQIVDEVAEPEQTVSGAPAPIVITASGERGLPSARPTADEDQPGRLTDRPAGGYYLADGLPLDGPLGGDGPGGL
jgi:hypothetical protein